MMHQWIIFNSPLAKGHLRYLEPSESCKYIRFINKGIYGCLMLRLLYQDLFSTNQYGNFLLSELTNSDLWNFLLLKHYTESRDIITAPVHQLFIDKAKELSQKTNGKLVDRLSTDLIKEYQRRQLKILHNRVKSVQLPCYKPHPLQPNIFTHPTRQLLNPQPTQSTPLDLRTHLVRNPSPRIINSESTTQQSIEHYKEPPVVLPRSRLANTSPCPPSTSKTFNTPFEKRNLPPKKQLIYAPHSNKSYKLPTQTTVNNSTKHKK